MFDRACSLNYKNYIYINFDENPAYKAIFDGDLDIETLIKQISLRVPNARVSTKQYINIFR